MALLFGLESTCFASMEKGASPVISLEHHQSFIPGCVLPRYPCSSSSSILRLSSTSSNAQPESKPSGKRNARSTTRDTQLCKELQLFLSSKGLPLDKVPSTKELANHGRDDLAKIVRRRGYKAVQALLADFEAKQGVSQQEKRESSTRDDDVGATIADSNLNVKHLESAPSNDDAAHSPSSPRQNSTILEENVTDEAAKAATVIFNGSLTSNQGEEELRRRAAEFVRTGRLEQFPDSDEEEDEDDSEVFEDSSDEEEVSHVQSRLQSIEDIAAGKAAKLQSQLLPFLKTAASEESGGPLAESTSGSLAGFQRSKQSNEVSSQNWPNSGLAGDLELKEIKSALISKERELKEVCRDLEETKAQLALIQAKATAEVAQAKQLALEKDIRLKSADLVLANLKRVQVEYWGEGERVELAGSFNGWKHFISMESDPTSEIRKPNGLRGPMMWGTELWLYPGVYEIKFIIDGVWQVDQRREKVARNSLENNVLRVEP